MGAQGCKMIRCWALGAIVACAASLLIACNNAGTIIGGYSVDGASAPGNTDDNGFPQGAHGAMAQIATNGGAVLQAPVLQVATFNSDPNAALYEAFIAALPHSAYWSATTAEYGVGAATAATPQQASITASTGLTDGALSGGENSDIETFLTAQLDVASPPWGAPSASTLYVLFMPPGVAVSLNSNAPASACAGNVLAWHTAMLLPQSQVTIAYVVVPDCGAQGSLTAIDSRTIAASHAIIEAVTNPHIDAYTAFDAEHTAWQLPAGGTEVGAACVAALSGDASLFTTPTDIGFAVQRTWSNAKAAAGHAPCVPAPAVDVEPYFDSIPVLTQSVTLPLGVSLLDPNLTMAGVALPPGTSAAVPLQLFSDGTTSGPWTLTATEVGTTHMTLSTSQAQGNNGDSITLNMAAQAQATGYSLVQLSSALGTRRHSQYIVVTH